MAEQLPAGKEWTGSTSLQTVSEEIICVICPEGCSLHFANPAGKTEVYLGKEVTLR